MSHVETTGWFISQSTPLGTRSYVSRLMPIFTHLSKTVRIFLPLAGWLYLCLSMVYLMLFLSIYLSIYYSICISLWWVYHSWFIYFSVSQYIYIYIYIYSVYIYLILFIFSNLSLSFRSLALHISLSYIYIGIHRQIYFILSELISVARHTSFP